MHFVALFTFMGYSHFGVSWLGFGTKCTAIMKPRLFCQSERQTNHDQAMQAGDVKGWTTRSS